MVRYTKIIIILFNPLIFSLSDNIQLDTSNIKLLFVYVVYVCVVPELKRPSAFSESGWLAYDGPRDERHRGEAENMFFTPIFTRRKIYCMRVLLRMAKLRADKASEPDSVDPQLLKSAGDSIIPSLLSVLNISSTCNTVPATWKAANISAPYNASKCARKIDGVYGGVNYYHACPWTGTWEPSPVGVWRNSPFHSAPNEFPATFSQY